MRLSKHNSHRFWVTTSVFFVIGAFYYFYFFILAKKQQDNFEHRGFRILQQIEKNMEEKLENYKGSIQNYQNQSKIIKEIVDKIYEDGNGVVKGPESLRHERLKQILNKEDYYIDKRQEVLNELSQISFEDHTRDYVIQKMLDMMNYDLILSYGADTAAATSDIPVSKSYGARKDTVSYYVPIHTLMENLKFDDFFDYLLLQTNSGEIIYDPGGFNLSGDTLIEMHKNHLGSYIENLNIRSRKFKAFVSPVSLKNQKYYLIGMVPSREFNKASHQFNPIIISAGIIIILIVLVSLPLLKLGVMSKTERLKRSDIYLSCISIMILSSILILVLLHYVSSGIERRKKDNNLSELNTQITVSLQKELSKIMALLSDYNSRDSKEAFDPDPSKKIYPVYNELLLINQRGAIEKFKATLYPYIVKNPDEAKLDINVRNREYFRKANERKDLWKFHDRDFYMESVYSYATGQIEAAVSMPDSACVTAATSPLYSLIDVILPAGYSYIIFDKNGHTLFHSSKNKALRENFLIETDNDPEIVKAIYHHVPRFSNINYSNKSYRAYIAPLKTSALKTPLYIATFYDKSHSRKNNTLILIVAFFFVAILIVLTLILSFINSINNRQSTWLNFNRFSFYWLLPDSANRKYYKLLTAINAVIIIFLTYYYYIASDVLNILLTVFATVIFSSICAYLVLLDFSLKDFFRFKHQKKFFIETLCVLLVFTVIANLLLFGPASSAWLFNLLYSCFMLLSLLALFVYRNRSSKAKPSDQYSLYSFSRQYGVFVVSWLMVISVIPVTIFYKLAYQEIKKQELKNIHRVAIADYEQRKNFFSTGYLDKQQEQIKKNINRGVYISSIYQTQVIDKKEVPTADSRDTYNVAFFDEMGKVMNALSSLNRLTWRNNSLNEGYSTTVKSNNLYTAYCDVTETNCIYLKARLPQFSLPGFVRFSGILFWLALVLLIVGLFYLTRFFIRRIRIDHDPRFIVPLDDNTFKTLAEHKNIFLVGLPYSGKNQLINTYLKNYKEEDVEEYKLIDTNPTEIVVDVKRGNFKVVVLKDFEYNLHDLSANSNKLSLVESLQTEGLRIIISSICGVKQFIDIYLSYIDASEDREYKRRLYHEIDRWENVFYEYYTLYQPLPRSSFNQYSPNEKLAIGDELTQGIYLTELKPYISDYFRINEMKPEDITPKFRESVLFKIQEMAESYYFSLWNKSSRLGKYVLYDIAHDGFVNSKNSPTIRRLLKLGLIRSNGGLTLMNESFRNFILSSTPKSEALKMEKDARRKGTWSKFRMFLLIIIVAVVILFVIAEQDVINKLSAVLTALAAFLPAIYSMARSASEKGTGNLENED